MQMISLVFVAGVVYKSGKVKLACLCLLLCIHIWRDFSTSSLHEAYQE